MGPKDHPRASRDYYVAMGGMLLLGALWSPGIVILMLYLIVVAQWSIFLALIVLLSGFLGGILIYEKISSKALPALPSPRLRH